MKKIALCAAFYASVFIPAANIWAAQLGGAAHLSARQTKTTTLVQSVLPRPVRFREEDGRGLLARAWVNGQGPYTFAIDTGAGGSLLSRRVAAEAGVRETGGRPVWIGGLSGAGSVAGRNAVVRSLALGDEQNVIQSDGRFVVTERLAPGVDGVVDPAEAYGSLGFEIDLARGQMTAFDPRQTPLRRNENLPPDGTVVQWLTDGQSRRPFVMLEGGRRALLDTGSGFGLAVTADAARALGIMPGRGRQHGDVRDLGGGSITAHRIPPATVRVGSLVLRGIPTDLLTTARAGSPVLLGRDALRPFRLTFDPVNRLIRIVPG
ncbi:MAG TPA: aspartyl protease family protein [Pyrinomonadaceae bacterium]|nr:aspartyl protease family protein [Pyrinomonadaceae bacterium]